jgi:hypothetical protein
MLDIVCAAAILELHQSSNGVNAAEGRAEGGQQGQAPARRRPPATIQLAINELALRMQELEADAAAARSQLAGAHAAAARTAASRPGASLEASQRTVIRSLSARCGATSSQAASLRAERDRLAGRLAVLRASIGEAGGLPPGLEQLLIEPEPPGTPDSPQSRHTSVPSEGGTGAEGNAATALGMLELLRHSVTALQNGAPTLIANSEVLATLCYLTVRSLARAAMSADRGTGEAELTAMTATLEVLWAEIAAIADGQPRRQAGELTSFAECRPCNQLIAYFARE